MRTLISNIRGSCKSSQKLAKKYCTCMLVREGGGVLFRKAKQALKKVPAAPASRGRLMVME